MNSLTTPVRRSRLAYGATVALVIGLGLLWRSDLIPLPRFLAKYGGDALWALAVFTGLGFVIHRSATVWIALGAVSVAWSVEFLQLYQAPWIDAVRSTTLGRLALGTSFNSPDLIAYVVGIALGAFAECVCHDRQHAGS